jgi:carboxypeptidase T
MLTAATHGDEIITTEILLNLVEKLLAGYDVDARLKNIVDKNEVYFIPVVNPDGFTRRQRYEGGRDPNRSYPYPEDESIESTPSIAALRAFFHSRPIVGSIDFHAYGEMIMYPWAYTYDHIEAADKAQFHAVTEHMAKTNGYAYGPISEVIYVAKGSSCDYYYWKKKTKALAIEVGSQKAPPPQQIPAYTLEQTEPTWRFLESF